MIDPNLSWIHMFTYHFIGMLRSEFQTRYFQTLNGKHYCTRKWSSFEWHHGWIDLHECIERCNQLFCVFPTNSDIKRYKIFVRMQPVEPNINISVQHQKLVMMVFKMIQVFINMRYMLRYLGITVYYPCYLIDKNLVVIQNASNPDTDIKKNHMKI